ncbi:hypothetical protein GOC91_17610 [Sinorhizobium medicae]|uniref:Uncharacterized protein n=1 Tax=Sinorhizobium medicae TaxID=110321 RepID=A0A6G1WH80_9HYPH|nr:hypothetical protein [Sinorhizobium medicae]MDX0430656.1 hypothetical protein [Sinorhizobium medicae]MDX0443032.1 hypothetical protein [Sinorhizobium medicae]MDX0460550.1 hypothetical protein [Sinorhizobium medicae]MDX0484208.1 hypothetical protein [Sinorhizobium medicae]
MATRDLSGLNALVIGRSNLRSPVPEAFCLTFIVVSFGCGNTRDRLHARPVARGSCAPVPHQTSQCAEPAEMLPLLSQ